MNKHDYTDRIGWQRGQVFFQKSFFATGYQSFDTAY
jgi:hypothetical protein